MTLEDNASQIRVSFPSTTSLVAFNKHAARTNIKIGTKNWADHLSSCHYYKETKYQMVNYENPIRRSIFWHFDLLPFAETHEQLSGYFVLDCKDLDEAILWAEKIPTAEYGSIEIRPLWSPKKK